MGQVFKKCGRDGHFLADNGDNVGIGNGAGELVLQECFF